MAKHKLNPSPGDTFYHPITFNAYLVHSLTDDGWVRFRPINPMTNRPVEGPLFTEPTLDFIRKYRKQV